VGARRLLWDGATMRSSRPPALLVSAFVLLAGVVASRDALALKKPPCHPPNDANDTWACGTLGMTKPAENLFQHPEIVLIFWEDSVSGPVWSQYAGAPSPSYGEWVGWTKSLVNTPYFAGLAQYGDYQGQSGQISRPRMSAHAPIYEGPAVEVITDGIGYRRLFKYTNNFTRADVQSIIQAEIGRGTVPPLTDDGALYVVIPPPNTWASDCPKAGCNDWVQDPTTGLAYERIIIGNPDGGNPGPTLSHEIAEAIAVFQGAQVTGCTDNGVAKNVGLADVCGCDASYTEVQNGVNLSAYWSAADQACVIPESWGTLFASPGQGTAAKTPAGSMYMRQAYGGAGGVVATGADDNVYFWPGGSSSWLGQYEKFGVREAWFAEPIGPQGVEFAAGGGIVASLPSDTQFGRIQTYEVSQGWSASSFDRWQNLPAIPSGLPVTGMAVTSGGTVGVTDAAGNGWAYPTGGPWQAMGYGGDQIVASGENLLVLTESSGKQDFVAECAGWEPGSCWGAESLPGDTIATIVASPDTTNVGYVLSGSNGGLFVPWKGYVTQSLDFAVSSGYEASYELLHGGTFGNTLDAYACTTSPNDCAPNAWQLTDGSPQGRLISGAGMYATACESGLSEWCVNY
jgi:hypothetical protein